jgi:hypothetical protein
MKGFSDCVKVCKKFELEISDRHLVTTISQAESSYFSCRSNTPGGAYTYSYEYINTLVNI